jgi:D-alanine-D-alanine ligase-like ATP-grasp enzyme
MSGTNVWLKLLKSKIYKPRPYLLDFNNNVWELPYTFTLNHTVEEIIEHAENAKIERDRTEDLILRVKNELMLTAEEATEDFFLPKKITLQEFIKNSKFVFLGLHGGDGENGIIQKNLFNNGVLFNGSGEKTSAICMDKFKTGEFIRKLNIPEIKIAPQKVINIKNIDLNNIKNLWTILKTELRSKTLIVKPKDDGCSTGVARLYTDKDLKNYLQYLINKENFIPSPVLKNQRNIIEMPTTKTDEIMFEKFIETDSILIKGNKLKYTIRSGWVEITIGILERNKQIEAFNPSITIAEGQVLSVEEKFQGGTGINLTPPPKEIIKPNVVKKTKQLAIRLAKELGIKGYGRIDAFMNVKNGSILVIEVNTLPGLTPSTVIYHQALAEKKPIFPTEFLEFIIKNKGY